MSNELKFFREVDEKLFLKIGYQAEPLIFTYSSGGRELQIELDSAAEEEGRENVIYLEDKKGEWNHDKHNFAVHMNFYLNNPQFLFMESGVADPDATVGIALSWFSKTSKQRGIEKIGIIDGTYAGPYKGSFRHTFRKQQFMGEVSLELILYLEKPAPESSPQFAGQPGTVLGTLDTKTIIIDGTGSSFPIAEVHAPGRPLWFVHFDITDPMSDPFTEEYVCININTAHKNYNLISGKKEQTDSPVLTEVLSSALQVIVQKVLESPDKENILSGEGFEEGSIAQAVYYFISTFEWDISSPERLADTIRRDWEMRIGGEYQ